MGRKFIAFQIVCALIAIIAVMAPTACEVAAMWLVGALGCFCGSNALVSVGTAKAAPKPEPTEEGS